MKKKALFIVLIAVVFLAVAFVPISHRDGGTTAYCALTYKVVNWNRLIDNRLYSSQRVYLFPDNFRSLDDLWAEELPQETPNATKSFTAIVLNLQDGSVLVRPAFCEMEYRSSDLISFSLEGLPDIGAQFRSAVKIYYDGNIMESYPAQIRVTAWEPDDSLRSREYGDQWLSENAVPYEYSVSDATLIISEVYKDCFFVGAVNGSSVLLKVNGQLDEQWNVGDYITLTCENVLWEEAAGRLEADLISVEASDWRPDPNKVLYD